MVYAPEKTQDFKNLFNQTYPHIRNFDGCRFLELYEDKEQPNTFYTISKWDNSEHLEEYRKSNLFRIPGRLQSHFSPLHPLLIVWVKMWKT